MKSKNIFVFIITLAFVLFTAGSLSAQEKKIDKKELPAAVLNTFQNSYPDAAIKGTSIEKEKGKTYYEIESIEGTQRKDFLYTKEGKVAEIEETLALNNIPSFVKSSVMKKIPNCEINKAEKVTRDKYVTYELVVEHGMHKNEVVLDSKGNIQKVKKMKKENEEKQDKENEKTDNDKH
ncbi:MAG: PepSY-like domain-containing protein [Ignavibacteriaceae bacterium]